MFSRLRICVAYNLETHDSYGAEQEESGFLTAQTSRNSNSTTQGFLHSSMVRAEAAVSSAGYSGNLQSQAQGWIEEVTGEAFQGEFEDYLRDGVKLCELINKIKPGTVRRVNAYKEGQKFKQV